MLINIKEINKNLFFSPLSETNDTRPADIYTFVPVEYPQLTQELNNYSKKLKYRDNHRLLENYIDIDFMQFPLVSMWKKNNEIVGFSTGYIRDFYPKRSIRLLNKFYHDKENSRVRFTREVLRPATFHCIQQQILLSQKLDFNCAFITREPRTNKFFKQFVNALSYRGSHNWNFKEGPFLVTPSHNNPKAWQSIAYTKFKGTENDFWQHWRTK
jgi:hypothetical protein